ncbi:LINE-1 type transposase domain-containing protein 1 [Marmota marmota marmota]|uniref:LINE-1 type transposase domain-containing protein 1 n=1 Tax=Marmota marmota marmota TaxID=9994 RepID=UPI0020934E59|nr:LINE-1 type transposase domain-containing protein 1 [Marmota marmota marmota]
MSPVQSKMSRLAKEQEKSTCVKRNQLRGTDEELPRMLDFKYKDHLSTTIVEKFKVLLQMQNVMFFEMRETLRKELKEMLAKSKISETKDTEHDGSREEWQEAKDLASQKTEFVEQEEKNSKFTEYTENLTFRKGEIYEPSCKWDKAKMSTSSQGKEFSQNEPQSYQAIGGMAEASEMNDTCRNGSHHIRLPDKEKPKHREGRAVKAMEEENHQSLSNKEKTIKASREEETLMDEGVVLTLAADPLALATLEVSKQWGNIFNILRENGFGPEFQCEVQLAFKCDGEMKTFSDLQSLRQFTSQNPVIGELLNPFLRQKEKPKQGGGCGIPPKGGKALVNSKHEAGGTANDGLHSLFIKEVKVTTPEVKNLETREEEFSERKDKGIPTFEVTGEDSESEEGNTSYVRAKEEEGACAMEEEEEWWEEEEEWWEEEEEGEDDSILCEKGDSTCRLVPATSVMGKMGADEEIMVFSKVRNPENEEKEEVGGFFMGKTLQTQTSKEADLIQETETNYRTTVIGVLREMGEEIGKMKKCLPDILETENTIDDLRSRIDILEERLCNLDDEMKKLSKNTIQMAKQIINKETLREREDRFRSANIRLIGIPEKESEENEAEDIVQEIIEENFPELWDSCLGIVRAHRIPSMIDKNRLTPRHILVKFLNCSDKEKILKASREKKEITYRGTRIRLTADLSLGTLDARSQWSNIIKVLQEKGFHPRILYPAKLAFDFQGQTKVFFDMEEFWKFISCVPTLKELLEKTT